MADLGVKEDMEAVRTERALVGLGWAHGVFYLITGWWPILHLPSFLAVTGMKTDLWLVQTVGALIAVVGASLSFAAHRKRFVAEIRILAIGSAVALAGVDIVFVTRDIIARIYLLDAAGELALAAAWIALSAGRPRKKSG